MEDKLPTLRFTQIRVGDILIRENDHLGRSDMRIAVLKAQGRHMWTAPEGSQQGHPWAVEQLSAQNYSIIERNGTRIGTFCVKYW